MPSSEIGGYFGLELPSGTEYHPDAIHLNSGRSGLHYILKAKHFRKIWLPHYICDSVLTPIKTEHVSFEYYSINENFEPAFDGEIKDDECLLYVNYFGLNDENVRKAAGKYRNVIIDNTQAFYARPLSGVDTLYSPRKFFGVADGGYLYTDKLLDEELMQDVSYERMGHLLKRLDISANAGYSLFRENSEDIDRCGLRKMSNLTQAILSGIDYAAAAKRRRENYLYLHERLGDMNLLNLPELHEQVPMIYPFLTDDEELRQKLIDEKIYVATYWPDVMNHAAAGSVEERFVKRLLALPIDQRYGEGEMVNIIKSVNNGV